MNYWVIQNGNKLGPLSEAQVRALHLTADTPVWRTGMPDWTTAGAIAELADTIVYPTAATVMAPPIPAATPLQSSAPQTGIERPAGYLVWSIIVTLLCCTPAGIVAIVYSALTDSRWSHGDYDGARKASDTAQLWIIIAIVLGLIAIPFQIIMMMF